MKTFPIYSAAHADLLKDQAGQKYRPSNGSEGEMFMNTWCGQCERDHGMLKGLPLEECDDNQVCGIIALTHFLAVDDPRYPAEWQYGADGQPCCTAFVPAGEPIPVKDEHTVDMFGGCPT
jgi:hypothetical protein